MYFVHSYAPPAGPTTWSPPATTAGRWWRRWRRDRVWATQFHPEKSGAVGLALLANFVAAVAARRPG